MCPDNFIRDSVIAPLLLLLRCRCHSVFVFKRPRRHISGHFGDEFAVIVVMLVSVWKCGGGGNHAELLLLIYRERRRPAATAGGLRRTYARCRRAPATRRFSQDRRTAAVVDAWTMSTFCVQLRPSPTTRPAKTRGRFYVTATTRV